MILEKSCSEERFAIIGGYSRSGAARSRKRGEVMAARQGVTFVATLATLVAIITLNHKNRP